MFSLLRLFNFSYGQGFQIGAAKMDSVQSNGTSYGLRQSEADLQRLYSVILKLVYKTTFHKAVFDQVYR